MRIAVSDDDPEILEQISSALKERGYEFDLFRNGTEAKNALRRETYDVALLDWNMPGLTGLELVQWATENLEQPPRLILLTSRSQEDDIVTGLRSGASDYIIKPESSRVIIARIEAAVRDLSEKEVERFSEFGPYNLDNQSEKIQCDGKPVKLTPMEFRLARLLFNNLNRPLSRGYILSAVWGGGADIETRTVDMHVSRLRNKLGLRAENGFALQTVFGFGYRLSSEVDADV